MNKLDRTSFSILVVDDDPDMLRGTTRILDRAGYATATADSGEAALAAMSLQHPNLVLLDWDMPGMDGIEVCKRIKGNPAFSDSLVIMISAIHTESEEQAAGLESGADGYISRPISNRELVARVESFARIWDLHHSLRESEARVRSMLHATPIGLGMTLDSIFTEVNEAVVRMTGYQRDELIGQSDRMLFTSDAEFEQANLQNQAQINEQGIGTVETRWRRKDGEIRDICISSTPTDPDDAAQGVTFSAEDITERKKAEVEIRIGATAFLGSLEGMVITDAQKLILKTNKAFSEITGYSAEEVLGKMVSFLISCNSEASVCEAMQSDLVANSEWRGEILSRRRSGEGYPVFLSISAIKDGKGSVTHYIGGFSDITTRKAIELQIENLAFYDPLTDLPNRRLLLDRLQQAVTSSARRQSQSALLFIDLDEFKHLNDTAGHASGDLLLKQVAKRLRACVRDGDTVARLGGDEFVLLLDGLSAVTTEAAAQALSVGQKILTALAQPYQLGTFEHWCTASIGIKLLDAEANQAWDEALQQADKAMYQAKAAGRNALCFFEPHSNS